MTPTGKKNDSGSPEPLPARTPPWRDSMAWVVGGVISLVVGANAVMIAIALDVKPSLVREDYYEASKRVDQDSALRRAGEALGWRVTAVESGTHPGGVLLRVVDAAGEPISGLSGNARGYRPSDVAWDQPLGWREMPGGGGLYAVKWNRPLAGNWRLKLELGHGEKQQMATELSVLLP